MTSPHTSSNASPSVARTIVVLVCALAVLLAFAPSSMGSVSVSQGPSRLAIPELAPGGAPTAGTSAWLLPLPGYDEPAPTRASLRAAGVLARDFAPPNVTWGPGHRGVDLQAGEGTPVRAPQAGIITFSGIVVNRPLVVVTHADGKRTTLEPVIGLVAVGSAVTVGEPIGTLDAGTSSHCAPESCLHWGVRRGETYLDPLSFLDIRPIILLPID